MHSPWALDLGVVMEKVAGIDGRRWWVQADNMEAGVFPPLYIFLLNSFFEPLLAELHLLCIILQYFMSTVVGSNI